MLRDVSKVMCDRRTFAKFSEDELHVFWQAQHFEDLHLHLPAAL
jgi:hypothetical protein